MTFSTLEPSRIRGPHSACPRCGGPVNLPVWRSIADAGLRLLAGLVLSFLLILVAVIVWKFCSDFLWDRDSHSILYRPLEDWTH